MIYTPKTKLALMLCFEAHKNQVDKSGTPYVFHPFHVVEQMKDETSTIVVLLTHDEAVPYLEQTAVRPTSSTKAASGS